MKLFTAHRNWWSSLSSTFIGSLLGIGITFAISDYIQTQHQTRMSKRMIVMTIDEMDRMNKTMRDNIDHLAHADSIFTAVEYYYEREIPMPADSVGLFYQILYRTSMNDDENIVQNIFRSNVEVMDIFEDLSIVKDINDLFGFVNMQKTCYDKTQTIIHEMLEYNLQNRIQEKDDFLENFTNYQYDHYKADYNFMIFHAYTLILSTINEQIAQYIIQLQQKLGISTSDIKTLNNSRLEHKPISVHEKQSTTKEYDSKGNVKKVEQTVERQERNPHNNEK